MAENKKSFILYTDKLEMWEECTNEEAGQLIKHILRYVNDENPVLENRDLRFAWLGIKSQLNKDLESYKDKIEQNSINGRVGNLKRWNKDLFKEYNAGQISLEEAEHIANNRKGSPPDRPPIAPDRPGSPPIAKIADTDTDTVTDTDTDILLKKETKESFIEFPENESDNPPAKKEKKVAPKKEKPFSFKSALLEFGFSPDLVNEWLMIRKRKKAINSEISFNNIIEQIKKTNQPPDNVLKIIVNKQWKGFNAEWLLNENNNGNTDNRPKQTNTRKVSGHQYAAGILSEQLAANSESFDYSITP